jgi:isoleucyl-tRNA synthetase
MRKDLDLDIEEEITVELSIADDRVADLVRERESLIAEEVRADAFGDVANGHRETWDVEGVEMTIAIEPVAKAAA